MLKARLEGELDRNEPVIDAVLNDLVDGFCNDLHHNEDTLDDVVSTIRRKLMNQLSGNSRRISSVVAALDTELNGTLDRNAEMMLPVAELVANRQEQSIPSPVITPPPPPLPPPPPPQNGGDQTQHDCDINDIYNQLRANGIRGASFNGIGVYYGLNLVVQPGCCSISPVSGQMLSQADMDRLPQGGNGDVKGRIWFPGPYFGTQGSPPGYNEWVAQAMQGFPMGTCAGGGDDTTPGGDGNDTSGCCPPPECCPPDPVNPDTEEHGGSDQQCADPAKVSSKDIRFVQLLDVGEKKGGEAYLYSECGNRYFREKASKAEPSSFWADLLDSDNWQENLSGVGAGDGDIDLELQDVTKYIHCDPLMGCKIGGK